jgi:hypothetical protein
VAPSRIESGLGAALPDSELVPRFARLGTGYLKQLQLAWDAVNHDWRRHVVGFNRDRQRSLWRDWRIDTVQPVWIVTLAAAFIAGWGALLLGVLGWWRQRHGDRARALWDALCLRLARAGLPRMPHEGPLAYAARAAARWPEFAVAFRVIGDSYAQLRYGPAASASARDDGDRRRTAALARLARAVEVLPAPAALRALP